LILAKSLGTYAADWAARRRYPAIWLTPVLTDDFVAEALTNYPVKAVMVGGTKDPLWDSRRAAATKLQITELPDADHALHVAGDWRGSVSVGADADSGGAVCHRRPLLPGLVVPGLVVLGGSVTSGVCPARAVKTRG